MPDEPAIDHEQEKSSIDKWKPALRAGVALIAVWFVIVIFYIAVNTVLLSYLRPLWTFWWEYDSGAHPVYTTIYYLLYGGLLLVLASLMVTKKGWHEALFDELQLAKSKLSMNYFAIGLIAGAIAIVVINMAITLSDAYLFNGLLYLGLIPERLAAAALLTVPILVMSLGQVALIQGYFQRTISKNYGWIAGLIVAAFIYTLLSIFPSLASLIFSPQYYVDHFLTGAIIAYLFYLSKSIYMPIGFTFAWYLFSRVDGIFTQVGWIAPVPMFQGYSMTMVSYLLRVSILVLVLALIWYFGHKPQEELDELKGKLKNAINFFRYHDE